MLQKLQNCNLEVLIQLTLTETKPHIKNKAVLIIDFDLVQLVSISIQSTTKYSWTLRLNSQIGWMLTNFHLEKMRELVMQWMEIKGTNTGGPTVLRLIAPTQGRLNTGRDNLRNRDFLI